MMGIFFEPDDRLLRLWGGPEVPLALRRLRRLESWMNNVIEVHFDTPRSEIAKLEKEVALAFYLRKFNIGSAF